MARTDQMEELEELISAFGIRCQAGYYLCCIMRVNAMNNTVQTLDVDKSTSKLVNWSLAN